MACFEGKKNIRLKLLKTVEKRLIFHGFCGGVGVFWPFDGKCGVMRVKGGECTEIFGILALFGVLKALDAEGANDRRKVVGICAF